jgi:hypothetical protein
VKSFEDALAEDPLNGKISATEDIRPPLLGLGADPKKARKVLAG